MDREQILARLNLLAVLPVMAKVVGFDEEAKRLTQGWNATIQFGFLGGPTVQLKFDDGACRAYRQPAARADLSFWFPTAKMLNNMFSGKGFALPLINGFWNIKLIKGFTALSKRMEHYLKGLDNQELDEQTALRVLECKLAVATWGTAVLAEYDPHVKDIAEHIPAGGVANIVVQPSGPNFFFKKTSAGAFLAGDGTVKDPTVELIFSSPTIAFQLVNGKLDAMAALGTGDVVTRGYVLMVDDVSAIMSKIERYLA
jgi:hypothetical protein